MASYPWTAACWHPAVSAWSQLIVGGSHTHVRTAGEGMPDGMMGGMMGGGGSSGPKLCFATLTADPERTKKETESMAMRFSELLRSGGAPEHQVYTIDENTILFSVVKDGHAGKVTSTRGATRTPPRTGPCLVRSAVAQR
eukprot:scaffold928_cov370-Prasinococcus_capsulatus_cf.AAC.11